MTNYKNSSILLLIISIIINAQVSTQEYIIGGLSSNIVDYPYQVAIVQNEQLWCSGSILSLHKVLTSANCVISSISRLKVHAGTSFWTRPRSVHNVVNYIMHGFDESTDLAILVVDEPFIFDMTRHPIK
ncbi:PREDICTED: hypodermin-A [Ceratosolen solmsi marchali]|uniref:Hypodermin-A n=1 Tax=Ceratosolen solmsi marchali TaxID=326594 RepID=A0AAJ6YQD3_9HYME|nr:PREDICTED: hypodermin-A [Ceratosolen solmsi marchali]